MYRFKSGLTIAGTTALIYQTQSEKDSNRNAITRSFSSTYRIANLAYTAVTISSAYVYLIYW